MVADLDATAAANSPARQRDAATIHAADGSGRSHLFAALVATSAFSSNVSADKVGTYDTQGEMLDTRRYDVALAGGDVTAGEAGSAARQDSWLDRRQGFEDLWHHGRELVYGAVNAGGMGTEGRFGPFCLVLTDPTVDRPLALAVFPADSAQRYTPDRGIVDDSRARAEVTAWADRSHLAVLECWAAASSKPQDEWPALVCRPGRYLEAVRAGSLPVSAIGQVRMRTALLNRLRDLRARELAREPLGGTERNEVHAYSCFQRWRRAHGTRIVGTE